ncbi:type II toxin-antitoxin system HicA family toxin [Glaciihabitans sp. INWT7]|uniref:type II toxin-antitoxin system HicA family toxin n=1 Tax=Glaciihabitans sp. INWT7 TaxID=2596912 RepID=UPI001624E99C|nr:type II toxin-antitoxin system HicA family toxin [Glaciihabitans sp. INWT7]QNE46135.1 type II toxin-antitoxin system HicA family toxin [Glaciihabitans sp. INWT7]
MTKPQKYRDVTKFLRSKGWDFKRQTGSHEVWGPADGSQSFSLVEHHGEVSTGVVRQLQRLFSDTPSKWN